MIVVGSVNIDLVVSVHRLPLRGETVTGGRFARHHGGKGGNQAVAAARLGARTAFVGAVGGDTFGVEARAALAAEGIDLRGLATLEHETTGIALIVVDAGGENSIAVAGGANAALTPDLVGQGLRTLKPGPGDVVLVGHEIPTESTREALRLGRDAGAITILNPAPATDLDGTILALADVLTPNRGELAILTGGMADAGDAGDAGDASDAGDAGDAVGPVGPLAATLLTGDPRRAVLVSLGADGALLVEAGGTTALDPLTVAVIDTVGAGDTLNGALAAGLAAGLELSVAARRAVAAASLAVARAGAREGMPTSAELQAASG